jgi:hypothetical protein
MGQQPLHADVLNSIAGLTHAEPQKQKGKSLKKPAEKHLKTPHTAPLSCQHLSYHVAAETETQR